MAELFQAGEIEKSGISLDGMDASEGLVEQIPVAWLELQITHTVYKSQ